MPAYHATWASLRGAEYGKGFLRMGDLVQASADAGLALAPTTIRQLVTAPGMPRPVRIGRGHFGYTAQHRDAVVAEAARRLSRREK